jgi:hypothetical protein
MEISKETDALWTRLFAEWLEEQARLVIDELERPPANTDGSR